MEMRRGACGAACNKHKINVSSRSHFYITSESVLLAPRPRLHYTCHALLKSSVYVCRAPAQNDLKNTEYD